MLYIRRQYKDDDNSKQKASVSEVFLEVNSEGKVTREIELDGFGKVVHKCPSKDFKHGTYGYFDMSRFNPQELTSDFSKEEFEVFWER